MKKILIVDNDSDILESLSILLEDTGYHVATTLHSEEVFKKAHTFNPNLILLDLLLSGKDGCEVTRELRKNPKTKKIPIIMMSAHPQAEKSASDCGVEGFIAKPFDMNLLLNSIQRYLKQ